jgi:DNA-binding winged helix-turn-helix (wHTH) protein
LADSVWGSTFIADDTINMMMSRLRQCLRQLGAESELSVRTRRGVGYQLIVQIDTAFTEQ